MSPGGTVGRMECEVEWRRELDMLREKNCVLAAELRRVNHELIVLRERITLIEQMTGTGVPSHAPGAFDNHENHDNCSDDAGASQCGQEVYGSDFVRAPGSPISGLGAISKSGQVAGTLSPQSSSEPQDVQEQDAAVSADQKPQNKPVHGTNDSLQNGSLSSSKAGNKKVSTSGLTGSIRKRKEPKVQIAGQSRYWTNDEHRLFLEALKIYGHKDLRGISEFVGTRNMTQVRTHTQKYFMKLMREAKRRQESEGKFDVSISTPESTPFSQSGASPVWNALSRDHANVKEGSGKHQAPAQTTEQDEIIEDKEIFSPIHTPAPTPATSPDLLNLHGAESKGHREQNQDVRSVPETCGVSLLSMVAQATR
mmetsp:Transcript_16132/g.16262  ORF Transcript_16132/g.16262 Transcript_16132/m.16262 type:complete len:367 (-) Transcript_16132:243-1343(-)